MKAVNVDDVLKILHKYGKYIFVTDEKRYSSMVDEIANLKALEQETVSKESYDHEYFLRKEFELKIDKLQCQLEEQEVKAEPILDKIRAEIDKIYEREGNSVDCLNALDELKCFIDRCKGETEE